VSPTVRVVVGDDKDTSMQPFFIPKNLLTSRSRFFAKALKEYTDPAQVDEANKDDNAINVITFKWREGEEGVIKLTVDKPNIFTNYVQLIYTDVLPICNEPEQPELDTSLLTEDAKKAGLDAWDGACQTVHSPRKSIRLLREDPRYYGKDALYSLPSSKSPTPTTTKRSTLLSFPALSRTFMPAQCYLIHRGRFS
jgi:hypothetical protein